MLLWFSQWKPIRWILIDSMHEVIVDSVDTKIPSSSWIASHRKVFWLLLQKKNWINTRFEVYQTKYDKCHVICLLYRLRCNVNEIIWMVMPIFHVFRLAFFHSSTFNFGCTIEIRWFCAQQCSIKLPSQ